MNQTKRVYQKPYKNRLSPAAFLRIRIPGFLLILAMVFITFGCDSIVDQQTEADDAIESSDMAGALPMLQSSEIACIDPTTLIYNKMTNSKSVEWGNPRNPFEKTVDIEYYNTLTEFVIRVKSTQTIADVLVDNESIKDFDGTVAADIWQEFALDLDEDWESGEKQTFSLKVAGSGPAAEFEVDYTLVGACWLEVVSETGRIWMDRNLGASRAATSSRDAQAYGDLYQWGRAADGHQLRNSVIYNLSLASTFEPNKGNAWDGKFTTSFSDWLSSQNNDLWQGVDGINNPCPVGYRIPTMAEWQDERLSWSSNNAAGAFNSPLKLSVAGIRINKSGSISGIHGGYWGSFLAGSRLYLSDVNSFPNRVARADGYSVRCIKHWRVIIITHPTFHHAIPPWRDDI